MYGFGSKEIIPPLYRILPLHVHERAEEKESRYIQK
jgi:hypothetical protein